MPHFGIWRWYQLETFASKSSWQKNLIHDIIFRFLMTSAKMISRLLNTYGSLDQSNGVIYQRLLSSGISAENFCFIPCVKQISGGGGGGGCTLQTSNCRLEYLFNCMLGTFKLLLLRTLLSFSYLFYNIQFNYSVCMPESYEKGFEQ